MKIAVTGHRPNKLRNAYEIMHPINIQMGVQMRAIILELAGYDKETNSFADDEVFTIISGMALGVDTIWALVAVKLKRQFPKKFLLECAIPCKKQESKWPKQSQKRHQDILAQADKVTYVTETTYTPACMQKRNEYMVNEADFLYGVWDGTSGGTKNCIDYAKKHDVTIRIEDPTPWINKFEQDKSIK